MTTNVIEIESTWKQIVAQVPRYWKYKMRLTILPETPADVPTKDAEPQTLRFANAWEYLQSLPVRAKTPEDWERIEREIQEEKDSWSD